MLLQTRSRNNNSGTVACYIAYKLGSDISDLLYERIRFM